MGLKQRNHWDDQWCNIKAIEYSLDYSKRLLESLKKDIKMYESRIKLLKANPHLQKDNFGDSIIKKGNVCKS